MKTNNKIDVHHHIFPKEYVEALNKVGIETSLGVKLPKWDVNTSLKAMKSNDIQKAIVSISSPGVYFPEAETHPGFSEELARISNHAIAEIIKSHPEKFGGFATIPMLNKEASMEEIKYAYEELKLDGVCLLTNYNGHYLGDPIFEEVFMELNNRKAVVFLHPNDPAEEYDSKLGIPNALVEVTFDTTRCVANLLHKGILDKYPYIRFILSHGGGTIPYLAWRMAGIEYGQEGKKPPVIRALYDYLIRKEPTKGLKHLRNMYYDTAMVSGTYALKTLREFAGPDQIVYGSDLCINKLATVITKNLPNDGDFDEESYNKMAYGNCHNLFPSLNDSDR